MGGLGGEGEAEHLVRRHPAGGHQPDHPRRHHGGLARSGSGDHHLGRERGGDGGELLVAERVRRTGQGTQGLRRVEPAEAHDSTVPAALVGQMAWN
jgi:hypothetical protein